MLKSYTKSDIQKRLSRYFKNNICRNLYKNACLNYKDVTKDSDEIYSRVIVDYLVENIEEYKSQLYKMTITRTKPYKIRSLE